MDAWRQALALKSKVIWHGRFKIVISKAHDKVNCFFLRGVLERMWFGERWVWWMMTCVSFVNYLVLMNSDIVRPILSGRGGFIKGPFIILSLHYSSERTDNAYSSSGWKRRQTLGVNLYMYPCGTHLPFVDDSFLFCRANVAEVNQFIRILRTYEVASRQDIILTKSDLFISWNINFAAQKDLLRILGVCHVLGTCIFGTTLYDW